MDSAFERRLAFEGAVNFRDLGGYPVGGGRQTRWRRLYRSDNLGGLNARDLALLGDLDLHLLIDFRIESERLQLPNRLPPDAGFRTVEIGFLPQGTIDMFRAIAKGTITDLAEVERRVADQYRRFVTDHAAEYAKALALVREPGNLPALLHCTSGKDRTGFAIAIVLMALGATQETILEDYVLTNRFQRDISHLFGPSMPQATARQLMSAPARYLEAAFDQILVSYGSVDAYLERALALGDAERATLAELLTEAA